MAWHGAWYSACHSLAHVALGVAWHGAWYSACHSLAHVALAEFATRMLHHLSPSTIHTHHEAAAADDEVCNQPRLDFALAAPLALQINTINKSSSAS